MGYGGGVRIGRRGPSLGAVALLAIAVVVLVTGGGGSEDAELPAAGSITAEVIRVVDGDTIRVDLDGVEEPVRYIGVDTPESAIPGEPVECFGEEASRFNAGLVEDQTVRLEFDSERRDRYGRLLAYAHVGDTFVNAELIRQGFATTLTIPPNDSHAELFARFERAAGRDGRGLWEAC